MYILIALCLVLSISSLMNFLSIIKKRKEIRRLNQLNKEIYNEYKKIGGAEWAEKSLKYLIRKVVRNVDHNNITSRISRESRKIQCRPA